MGLSTGFHFCSRDFCFPFCPLFVLAEDGYHGEVYYLERTLASGECRGVGGLLETHKIASTKKTCDDFFVNEFLLEKESLICLICSLSVDFLLRYNTIWKGKPSTNGLNI